MSMRKLRAEEVRALAPQASAPPCSQMQSALKKIGMEDRTQLALWGA